MQKPIWIPRENFIRDCNLSHYSKWLEKQHGLSFSDYQSLWKWSTDEPALFWESIRDYFEVKSVGQYQEAFTGKMPETRWFEGTRLNYAQHLFRHANQEEPAIIYRSERHACERLSWDELSNRVASFQFFLRQEGIREGDRVVAYLPNIPEASIAFMAACGMGVIWSSCSPDFGANSVIDRFQQIEPKILIATDGYQYGGKRYDRSEEVKRIISSLPTIKKVVQVPFSDLLELPEIVTWESTQQNQAELTFTPLPFGHPIWVLYSSGTTGRPKAITHSHGGVLLEHLKYLSLHNDVRPGDRFFWFSTTGWMMWNYLHASLLCGATIVLYDGNPGYPDLSFLWSFAEEVQINHFGTSAPFITACENQGIKPNESFNLDALRSISSTGAPLSPNGFKWVYEAVKPDVWLCSMSGGTDVCTAFVGGCPWEPVYEGEIQCRALGCDLASFSDDGSELIEEVGEMVIKKPMPSMPVYFWNDPGKQRYKESYFDHYPGVWRHGDWVRITDRNSLVILGRSDATLNRHGIRIGTAEIYQSLEKITEIEDGLIINLELPSGGHYMPLFVKLKGDQVFTEELKKRIDQQILADNTRRHLPDEIIPVSDIPYTISGKKMEAPVKRIIMGMNIEKSVNTGAMKNPESLRFFTEWVHKGKPKSSEG